MSLNTSNLYTESFKLIKEFLLGIAGIDPRKRYRGNIIHSSMPNINDRGFDGYPFIILKIDAMEDHPSFDGQISEKIFRTQITIYCDDPKDLDNISDKIAYNFKDETRLTEFKNRELNSSPINYLMDVKGKKILHRNIWLIFRKRI